MKVFSGPLSPQKRLASYPKHYLWFRGTDSGSLPEKRLGHDAGAHGHGFGARQVPQGALARAYQLPSLTGEDAGLTNGPAPLLLTAPLPLTHSAPLFAAAGPPGDSKADASGPSEAHPSAAMRAGSPQVGEGGAAGAAPGGGTPLLDGARPGEPRGPS